MNLQQLAADLAAQKERLRALEHAVKLASNAEAKDDDIAARIQPHLLASTFAARQAMREALVSESELSRRMGVSRELIRIFTVSRGVGTFRTLHKIADALGCDVHIELRKKDASEQVTA